MPPAFTRLDTYQLTPWCRPCAASTPSISVEQEDIDKGRPRTHETRPRQVQRAPDGACNHVLSDTGSAHVDTQERRFTSPVHQRRGT